MTKISVPYFVIRAGRGGTERYFWQPSSTLRALGWRSERLPDDLAAAISRAQTLNEDLAAWRKGVRATRPDAPPPPERRLGTVADLIHRYRHSARYLNKRPATRKGYDWCLEMIQAWASKDPAMADGLAPIASITPPRVQTWYEHLHATRPGTANAVLRVLRLLLTFAVRSGDIPLNPAAKPGLITPPKSGRIWTPDQVNLLVSTADMMGLASIGDAIELAYWLGQRPTDIRQITWDQYRGGVFRIMQSKTGQVVEVDHSPRLAARLERARLRQKSKIVVAKGAPIVVCEATGRAYTEYHFSHTFAEVRAKAIELAAEEERTTLAALQFKHLRHTAITELARAGNTAEAIATISGHSFRSVATILEHYLVRNTAMAKTAVAKRLAAGGAASESDSRLGPSDSFSPRSK